MPPRASGATGRPRKHLFNCLRPRPSLAITARLEIASPYTEGVAGGQGWTCALLTSVGHGLRTVPPQANEPVGWQSPSGDPTAML